MVKLINRTHGTVMWVAEERLAEYLALGNTLAPDAQKKPQERLAETPAEMQAERRRGRKKAR